MDQGKKAEVPSKTDDVPVPRRQRAPTITIDTSGGDSNMSDGKVFESTSDTAPSDRPPRPSFSESRPTSPHNVSSPTHRGLEAPGSFLAVPGSRARTDSIGTEDSAQSPSSMGGETIVMNGSPSTQIGDGANGGATIDNTGIMNDPEALKEDPGAEADFVVDDNKFAFSPGQLSKLFNPKSLPAFYAMGGLKGLERGLRTDIQSGLSVDEQYLDGTVTFEDAIAAASDEPSESPNPPRLPRSNTAGTARTIDAKRADSYADRTRIYRDNRLPEKKAKSIFKLLWMTYNDKVLILLTIAAVVSLALGLYQTFQPHPPGVPRVEWVEGVAIMIAVLIVVIVGASNDWQKERQFVRLNKKKEDRVVRVIRSGKSREISVYDVLVGDVMHLEPGDLIPVDGVFISGHNVKCDESSATGESDLLKKSGGDRVYQAIKNDENLKKLDPLVISGGKVSEGVGTFLVTSVGIHSSHGKTMMALREDTEATPLQSKLNTMAEYIAKLGGAAALLLFIVLLIKFLVQLRHSTATPSQKGQNFLQILIVSITVVVVAVPEGLPLAVTLALAFATTRMLKDNNLVRVLRACETMGNATTVCSDKTGTLTQNKMTLVAGTVGATCQFGKKGAETAKDLDAPKGKKSLIPAVDEPDKVPISEVVGSLSSEVKDLLKQSIAINSTAFEGDENGNPVFIGSKTETALLGFARDYLGMGPVNEERSNANMVQFVPFDSGRKCMAAVVKLDSDKYRMYVKGASEILLAACTRIIQDPNQSSSTANITHEDMDSLNNVINSYASRSLRTIGLLFRDFEQWPPKGVRTSKDDNDQAVFEDIFKRMTLLSIVGIQDPLRDGVKEAVRACQSAGVFVRMVTGDNIMTARAIAEECGIYSPGGIIMEGPTFRKLGRAEMDRTIPRLQVLARSSPEDKRTLVKRLKLQGETVAVTGDGTNDAPALKTADVGFSMGIAGTEVAKEASAIILMDDNFSSIVKAIMWGRAVNDAVKKFLQFQVTVNITAVILTFVSAVSSNQEQSVLTAVQLLWVNLIMDTFAALALATDPPPPSILDRKPDPKSAPLITINMWKMIFGQAIYQLVVTFILFFAGASILSYQSDHERAQLSTLVFNTFVWMQIFNQYNNRRLDNKFNIFEGVTKNYFFIGINVIMVAGQIMIVFVGGRAFQVVRLNGAQWGYSIVLGALSLPIAVVIRLIPDELIGRLIPERFTRKPTPEVVISDEQRRFEWNSAMVEIREELMFLKRLRGGRLNTLKFKLQHPRETLLPGSGINSRSNSVPPSPGGDSQAGDIGSLSAPPTPESRSRRRGRSRSNSAFGPAAAMAGIVAGSIAGWSPIARGPGDGDPDHFGSALDRHALEEREGVEVHPATSSADPVVTDPSKIDSKAPPSQIPELNPTSKTAPNEHEQ